MARPAYRSAAYQRNRAALLADGVPCYWCGRPATVADHLVAVAEGGGAELDNLVASCVGCNAKRGGRLGWQRSHPDGQPRRLRRLPAIGVARPHGGQPVIRLDR